MARRRKIKRRFKAWIVLDELNDPYYSRTYPTRKQAMQDQVEWGFTGCRPCKVVILLPRKLPIQP